MIDYFIPHFFHNLFILNKQVIILEEVFLYYQNIYTLLIKYIAFYSGIDSLSKLIRETNPNEIKNKPQIHIIKLKNLPASVFGT